MYYWEIIHVVQGYAKHPLPFTNGLFLFSMLLKIFFWNQDLQNEAYVQLFMV